MILISIKYMLVFVVFFEFLKLYAFIKTTYMFGRCNHIFFVFYEFRKSENFRKLTKLVCSPERRVSLGCCFHWLK